VSDAAFRRVALLGPLAGERRTVHTTGFPLDADRLLPTPDVLLLAADREGGAMLFRYTAHGELAGDTWHPSPAAAFDQAEFEYGDALLGWIDVPEDVADAHDFAVRYAAERLDERS
jgi:hypothetical protein